MSRVTGIPSSNADVQAVYNQVYQAMPVQPKIAGFISSQQMGITQLAFEYCSTLVDDSTARDNFWPDFPWGTNKATAFNDRWRAIDPLVEHVVGINLPTQPTALQVEAELDQLITDLIATPGDTNAIMKGTCGAALGSAAMLIQ